jgi:hypothetical protein
MDCTEDTFWQKYVAEYSSRWWAGGLLLVAIVFWFVSRGYPHFDFLRPLAEFCGLAGALTITVDPFLKRKLQQEAGRDIFHHLLGLDLPVEIRETLRDFLLHNRFYRKDVDILVDIKSVGHEVELTMTMNALVVAVHRVAYCQHVAVEESDNGELLQASVTSTSFPGKSYTKNSKEAQLKDEPDNLMVRSWTGNKVELTRNEQLSTFLRIKVRKSNHDFHTINFGSSVINPRVRLQGSEDLILAIDRADQINGNEHIYKKVFLNGDHIQVRWKPKNKI